MSKGIQKAMSGALTEEIAHEKVKKLKKAVNLRPVEKLSELDSRESRA